MQTSGHALCSALVLTVLAASGCTVAKISGRGVAPILLNNPQTRVQLIKPVQASKHVMFDYTAAFDASEILSSVFAETRADAIINVTFTVTTTPVDFLLNLVTLGLAASKTMEITGDAVRAPRGLGSIDPPGAWILGESKNLDSLLPLIVTTGEGSVLSTAIVRVKAESGDSSYQLVRFDPSQIGD